MIGSSSPAMIRVGWRSVGSSGSEVQPAAAASWYA